MKILRTRTFYLLVSLMLLTSFSSSLSQNIESYFIKKINSSITIDGALDEKVWTLARATDDFVVLGSSRTPNTNSYTKLLWDDNYLYIAFVCQDEKVWATFDDRDDPLYQEDAFEVYIDPDGDGKNYLEIEVNPLNTIFDLWLTKPWSAGGQGHTEWTMEGMLSAISVDGTISQNSDTDGGWICEMAMPFSAMQFAAPSRNYPPKENDRWRFNMYRFDRSSTSNSVGEATGWSQTDGGQHEPDKFGVITFGGLMTEVVAHAEHIKQFALLQNYPNPFNPTTSIPFALHEAGTVTLTIFDAAGREIETLVNEHRSAGEYIETFTALDLATGVYFYRLTVGAMTATKKFVLQK